MSSFLVTLAPFALELLAKLAVIGIILVRGRGSAAARLTWIVVVLAVPLFGIVMYLLVGEIRPGRRRIARHRAIVERIERAEVALLDPPDDTAAPLPLRYQQIATLGEAVGNRVARHGNRLDLIGDTREFIDALVADIDAAAQHCHLLFYIYLDDHSGRRVAEALERAAARGVKCRLLVDAVGSKAFARSATRRRLGRAGVQVVEALPANPLRALIARIDLRNHRKIVVIDGIIGYLGSQNVADADFAIKPRYAPWVDMMVRVVGPVTHDLQVLFVEDWFLDTDESLEAVIASIPGPEPDGVACQVMGTGPSSFNVALRQLIQTAVHTASDEVILTTPYFVPDEATLIAIRTAARRGVDTSLIVPARNDSPLVAAASRSLYDTLLDAGVQIHEYGDGLLHAKSLTADRNLAVVGSANLGRRSFELNLEISLVVYDTDFASQVRFLQRSYMSRSQRVSAGRWKGRPWTSRLAENAAGTLGPLL